MVSSFADKKTPVEDGFTKEFYESFYGLIWRDLLNSYEAAFQNGSLSISQRGSITSIGGFHVTQISNSNWTEWSTIQGVIARVISKSDECEADLKLLFTIQYMESRN